MRISCIADLDVRSAEPCIKGARAAEQAGLDCFWIPGGWRDPLLLAAVAGREVPRIDLGTGIVTIWGMHPVALAEQALTANDAIGGRLKLGLGLSHFHQVEQRFGRKFERPIRYLREYLSILMQGLEKQSVDFQGELLSAHTQLRLNGLARPKVLIAALGPQAVRVAGALSDGTFTFMVPLKSLAEMTIPTASAAAADAGRPRPYFCAQSTICVTRDEGRVRDEIAAKFAQYGNGYYPSYQNALVRDGGGLTPRDVAIVGDEEAVRRELVRYRDAGVDEVCSVTCGTADEQARTRAFLGGLAKARSL